MILLDKGFFDYDYSIPDDKKEFVDWADTVKTEEELHDMLSGFGFGTGKKRQKTLDEIQSHIIKQESYGS